MRALVHKVMCLGDADENEQLYQNNQKTADIKSMPIVQKTPTLN